MYYSEKYAVADREAGTRAMKAQQREESAHSLVVEVCQLLNEPPGTDLTWTGSRSDLIEALHTAYLLGEVCDEHGHPYSFAAMVGHACKLLHCPVPRNPSAIAARARERKGVRQTNFFDRYCRMMRCDGDSTLPLHRMLRRR